MNLAILKCFMMSFQKASLNCDDKLISSMKHKIKVLTWPYAIVISVHCHLMFKVPKFNRSYML